MHSLNKQGTGYKLQIYIPEKCNMKALLLLDVMQHGLVVWLPMFQDNLLVPFSMAKQSKNTAGLLKEGLTSCPETSVTTNLHCVTSQKSKSLIYTMVEAWNHANVTISYISSGGNINVQRIKENVGL